MADLTQLEIEASVGQEDVTSVQNRASGRNHIRRGARQDVSRQGSACCADEGQQFGRGHLHRLHLGRSGAGGLLPGMTADADIIVSQRQNVLTLPRRSIRATANGSVPVTILQRGQAVSRTVEIGVVGDLNVEIVSGLQEGDQVVTTQ